MANADVLRQSIRRRGKANAQAAVFDLHLKVVSEAPRKTGNMRTSVDLPRVTGRDILVAKFHSPAPYSSYVDDGRRGFSKRPGGPMLRFKIGGKTLFRVSVGPAKPRRWFKSKIRKRWGPTVSRFYHVGR